MKKKIISITIILIMIMGTVAISYAASFKDLPSSHWAYQNVNQMVNKGIIVGYPDGTFRPNAKVTYGEFIKMSVVALTGKNPGVATGTEHWASKYYDEAVKSGLFAAGDISKSRLSNSIPRADMALIAANAVSGTVPASASTIIKGYIVDMYQATAAREEVVIKAYYNGILAGYPDKTFRAQDGLTRAESSAVIDRLINPSARLTIDLEAMKTAANLGVPTYPNGSTVAKDKLLSTIRSLDSNNLDVDGSSATFLKYANGGIYNMQASSDFLVQISYVDKKLVTGDFPDTARQKARIKFLLQHFLGNSWETCYNRFLAMEQNTNARNSYGGEIKFYNGREVTINGYEKEVTITIY